MLATSLLLVPATASGQQPAQPLGPPILLIPPPSSPPAVTPSVSTRNSAVVSEPLAPLPLGWSADIAPPQEALPWEFWRGTSRAIADLLLARVPTTLSPALQALQRRLLLSPAVAPEGPDDGGQMLPALHAAALLRLGELEAARAVIEATPESERGPALPVAVAADAISGDIGRACATVQATIHRDQGAFWHNSLIACQALQGETDQAVLGLQLLAEEQEPLDEALAGAIDALAGRPSTAALSRAETLDPLTLRLIVVARLNLAPAVVDVLPADLALCLALDEGAPAVTRVAAAERAARFGALPPDRLRTLYSTLPDGEQRNGEMGLEHASRFAAIGQAETPFDRLHRIIEFVNAFSASQAGGFMLAARLVLPALREIEPDARTAGSAPTVARLLIAAGDNRAARRWSALVPEIERGALRFLLAVATGRNELSPDQTDAQRNPMSLVLSSALGQSISPADWLRLPEVLWTGAGSPSPPLGAWLELSEASRARRIGETVLAAIMVAAPTGTLSNDPVALFTAVSALRQIGLETDARRLAVEVALADGL